MRNFLEYLPVILAIILIFAFVGAILLPLLIVMAKGCWALALA